MHPANIIFGANTKPVWEGILMSKTFFMIASVHFMVQIQILLGNTYIQSIFYDCLCLLLTIWSTSLNPLRRQVPETQVESCHDIDL